MSTGLRAAGAGTHLQTLCLRHHGSCLLPVTGLSGAVTSFGFQQELQHQDSSRHRRAAYSSNRMETLQLQFSFHYE